MIPPNHSDVGSTADCNPRSVVIVTYPGVLGLDVVGPLEVLAMANRFGAGPEYRPSVISTTGGLITATSGLVFGTERAGSLVGSIDTLIVAGGYHVSQAIGDHDLVGWLRGAAASARRVTSVCAGALLLAEAGLLDGRRATTHWTVCEVLENRYPSVRVEAGQVYVRDGHVWTSGGVTAGIDLALALVEHDHGPELALAVARELVVFVHRPGQFPQISAQLAVKRPVREPFREILALIAAHPDADLSVPTLARRCAMSVRNFSRAFRQGTGTTPALFVQASRIEAAKRLIQTSDTSFDDIARTCGFGTVETMHRAFQRVAGTTPGQFRPRRRQSAQNRPDGVPAPVSGSTRGDTYG